MNRAQACEARGMGPHDLGDVIVELTRKVEPVRRLRPVAEHDGHRRKHLHRDTGAITFVDSARRIPRVVADLAKEPVADHHPRATGTMMFHPNEPGVSIAGVQIGPFARQNMGVEIDLHDADF